MPLSHSEPFFLPMHYMSDCTPASVCCIARQGLTHAHDLSTRTNAAVKVSDFRYNHTAVDSIGISAAQVGRELRDAQGAVVRAIMCDGEWEGRDPDHIAWLANETVTSGHSVLVFCGTKKVIVFGL